MAQPNDDEDRYIKALISSVSDLSRQLGAVREQVKEDMAQLLRNYREDVHRSIMGIHVRIVSLEDTIETDRAARIARQTILDGQLAGIKHNQRVWIRGVVAVALMVVGLVIGWWLL